MTYKAEENRAKARECEERAERTGDYFIKEQLLEVAKKWRLIAQIRRKALAVGRLHELTARLRRSEQFHQVQSRYVLGAGQVKGQRPAAP